MDINRLFNIALDKKAYLQDHPGMNPWDGQQQLIKDKLELYNKVFKIYEENGIPRYADYMANLGTENRNKSPFTRLKDRIRDELDLSYNPHLQGRAYSKDKEKNPDEIVNRKIKAYDAKIKKEA